MGIARKSWFVPAIAKYSLESLISQARENGVECIACTMSMDVMGISKEELIDGIEYGGVASYLERAEESGLNLFV